MSTPRKAAKRARWSLVNIRADQKSSGRATSGATRVQANSTDTRASPATANRAARAIGTPVTTWNVRSQAGADQWARILSQGVATSA